MVIEIRPDAAPEDVASLLDRVRAHPDLAAWVIRLDGRAFVIVSGDESLIPDLRSSPVLRCQPTSGRGHWLVDRTCGLAPSRVSIGGDLVGGTGLWWAAGPCAVESAADAVATAREIRRQGGNAFRASLFKTRSSPYFFAGKGGAGLPLLAEVKGAVGLPVITEVHDPRDVPPVAEVADCLQVDPRNMTNRALLAELGRVGRPVLLMRGLHATVEEWLRSAEFVFSRGNREVVLCARGIVSFDDSLAFQPDYGAILAARRHTDLPVVFDPSHSTGRAEAVMPAALAAAAFGVDGLLVEAHVDPDRMYRPGDAAHMYPPHQLRRLAEACLRVRQAAQEIRGDHRHSVRADGPVAL